MSIQAVSFGATTKKGNLYKKTHVGTIAGAVAGATSIAMNLNNVRKIKMPKSALQPLVKHLQKMTEAGITKQSAKKIILNSLKTGMIGGAVGIGLILFGGGAAINKLINRNRANAADKAAQ